MNLFGVGGGYGGSITSQNYAYNSGQWGIDPSLRTEPWDAPYRPDTMGAPSAYAAYRTPGFFGAAANILSPFRREPIWGNPVDYNNASYQSLATKPFDAAAWAGQNVVAPIGTAVLAQRLFGGLGGSVGRGVFSGLATGLGASSRGMLAGGMGALGGLAGSALLPLALGQAMYKTLDYGAFRSYSDSALTGRNIQSSVANIAYGGSYGDPWTGRGLSPRQAARMGSQVDRSAVQDLTFSADQYHEIARSSGNYGLLDNVSGNQITERVRGIAQQVKLILAISKDPSIQNALEELSKLKMAGASVSGGINSVAASAYSRIASNASAAGITVQEMMSRVGTQGQYMYQSSGLTPYLGQIAASNLYAGFASAHRAGFLSDAQMARMGGIEGATQSAVGAQISSAQTTFGRMQASNRFLFGNGPSSSIVETVSKFGNAASRDPMAALGRMVLRGNEASSLMLEADNGKGLEEQAYQLLRSQGARPAGRNGKYSADQMAAALKGMGLPEDQIIAYINSRSAQTDPGSAKQRVAGINAMQREQTLAAISQNQAYAGVLGTAGRYITRGWNYTMNVAGDELGRPVNEIRGNVQEWLENKGNSLLYGYTLGPSSEEYTRGKYSLNVQGALDVSRKQSGQTSWLSRMTSMQDTNRYNVYSSLEKNANRSGELGDLARKILDPKTGADEKRKLLVEYSRKMGGREGRGVQEGLDTDTGLADSILAGLTNKTVSIQNQYSQTSDSAGLLKLNAGSTAFDNLQVAGQAQELMFQVGSEGMSFATEGLGLLKDPKYARLAASLGGMSNKDKLERIRGLATSSFGRGFGRSGFAASAMASPDDLLSGKVRPEQVTGDKGTQDQLRKAIQSKDRKAVSDILINQVSKQAGGIHGDELKLRGDLTSGEFASVTKATRDAARGMSSEAETGQSKFDLVMDSIGKMFSPGNGMNAVSDKFAQSTDKFAGAVDKLVKQLGGGAPQVPTGGMMDPGRNNRLNYR